MIKNKLLILFTILSALALGACGSSSSSSGGGGGGGGGKTINSSGGTGGSNGGTGGSANWVSLWNFGGAQGVEVKTSGSVNASFVFNDSLPTYGGDNPLILAADTNIVQDTAATADPGLGIPYQVPGDCNLYVGDGDGNNQDEPPITSLTVEAGVTVDFQSAWDATWAYVCVPGHLINHGTLMTSNDRTATLKRSFWIASAAYYGGRNSLINTSGDPAGAFNAGVQGIDVLYSVQNQGLMNASGADMAVGNGGNGGYIEVYTYDVGHIENTGTLTSRGGSSGDAMGGGGGYIWFYSALGHAYNSGNIDSSGGDGVTAGGNASEFYLAAESIGDVRNSGDILASGGSASDGNGGNANEILLYGRGGPVFNSGNLDAAGGDTTSVTANAGGGGFIEIGSEIDTVIGAFPAGNVLVSGNLDTSGGNAVAGATGSGNGGNGGSIDIWSWPDTIPADTKVSMLGYSTINATGGDGNTGGDGDLVQLLTDPDDVPLNGPGPIVNQAAINTSGGSVPVDATTGAGGSAGDVILITETTGPAESAYGRTITNSGAITARGGNNRELAAAAGTSAEVFLLGFDAVNNTAAIDVSGGSDSGTDGGVTGVGEDSGEVGIWSNGSLWISQPGFDGAVTNSGRLTANGGNGEYLGGSSGNFIWLEGWDTVNSGTLRLDGGDANAGLVGSTGGDGGDPGVAPLAAYVTCSNTGSLISNGGTGTTPGADGDIVSFVCP